MSIFVLRRVDPRRVDVASFGNVTGSRKTMKKESQVKLEQRDWESVSGEDGRHVDGTNERERMQYRCAESGLG